MKKKQNDLGSWEPQKEQLHWQPAGIGSSNRMVWAVIAGGLAIALILAITLLSASHLFPSLVFFRSKDAVAVMEHEEIFMEEFQYYLIQAAEENQLKNPDYTDKKQAKALRERALELLQADRIYPLLAEEMELVPETELYAERSQKLNDFETKRGTPLFAFQLQSKGLTEELWRSLILSDYAKQMLQAYARTHTDPEVLSARAQEIYQNNYVKLQVIQFSLLDSAGKPLSDKEAEKIRTKSYSVYQELQSDASFESLQDSLTGDSNIYVYDRLVGKGQTDPLLEQAAFSLKEDEVSTVIETEQGLFLLQRVAADDEFALREDEMVYLARQQLFEEWIDSFRKKYAIKPYRNQLKQLDIPAFLEQHTKQKEEADQQIQWMEQSQ